jgi:hypothetical protein
VHILGVVILKCASDIVPFHIKDIFYIIAVLCSTDWNRATSEFRGLSLVSTSPFSRQKLDPSFISATFRRLKFGTRYKVIDHSISNPKCSFCELNAGTFL